MASKSSKTHLVIAEKTIAAKRIAELLAEGPLKASSLRGVSFFELNRGGHPYVVVPLKGHIMNVDFPKRFAPWIGTDLKALIKAGINYVEQEKTIIGLLRAKAKGAEVVVVATDSDREGESIALEALACIDKGAKHIVKRAHFSAITKEDIEAAFSELGLVDHNLGNSADARREIDLIWGAVLTRFLSLVSGRLGRSFLSAGRVQSPTLALVVDREKLRRAFKSKPYWEVQATLKKESTSFTAGHKEGRFWEKKRAEEVMSKRAETMTVTKLTTSKRTLARPVPFNTTQFLRAATAIGLSAGRAMSIAEDLYQRGFTSYPRTDNTVYSKTLDLRKILRELQRVDAFAGDAGRLLGKEKLTPSRGKKATKDHPPIHPVSAPKQELNPHQWKVYELICRRFLATLEEDAVTENLAVELDMNGEPFVARGQRFIKRGWKAVYPYSKSEEVFLPELAKGEEVPVKDLELFSKETQPPARYSQGALIKMMEELNLGTKSTRHQIIQKLYSRGYISGGKAIEPNEIAFAIIEALEEYGEKVVKPDMTSELEKEMDQIAAGKKPRDEVVEDSRRFLEDVLADLVKNKDKIGGSLRKALRSDNEMAPCTGPNCKGKLVVRTSFARKRFLGCSEYPRCRVTYPLPQKGTLTPLEKHCPTCSAPMLKVLGRRRFEFCLDPDCATKEEWKAKIAARNKKKAAPGGKKK